MIDLHIHTVNSDGEFTTEEILKKAQSRNLAMVSITDHNSVSAYSDLDKLNIRELYDGKIIIGTELEFVYNGKLFDLLGYGVDLNVMKESELIKKCFVHSTIETESIICKVGGISKDTVNLSDTKPMCNPITQAKFLNKAKTDFNVVVGLCVGHDSLFIKYSEAPVTVLAVKDRVLAHNPLGAVYLADGFYRNKLFPPKNQF